jgi:transcriptional regulator with XRE-family HTH domain
MYVITEKLRQFRKAKGLTQPQIAEMLNMEQTTYSKIELAKSNLRYETAIQIAEIVERDVSEFTTIPIINNNVANTTLTHSSVNVNGDVTYNNCNTLPDKIVVLAEEMLSIVKEYFKAK